MSSLWTLEKPPREWEAWLCSRSAVGVQSATNRGWGKERKLPSTNMEQQPPCCSLKALEVCRRHTKLISAEGHNTGGQQRPRRRSSEASSGSRLT